MASATRSSKVSLVEPAWLLDKGAEPCVQCGTMTRWSVQRSGRYNYHSHEHHCKSCWAPSSTPFRDSAMTTTYHYYNGKEATEHHVRTRK